jgi:hypothetical protein
MMKKWLILTSSESGDHYQYFVMHPKEPTNKELDRFLKEHACDKDDDEIYEDVDSVAEIIESDFLTIPKK